MRRAAWLTALIVCATLQPAAAADQFYREDLRIAASGAGALREAAERAGMSP